MESTRAALKPTRGARRSRLWLGAIILTLVSSPPRIAQLSNLSFHGDEETTALAARALAETGTAQMPSGMEYRRALPFTWLNATIAERMGLDEEASYRLGSAAIGSLTPAALFLVGATLIGGAPAFVAGSLLAVSEWHVVFSRLARMYAPLMFFYLLTAVWLWQWATTGRGRFLALGSVAFALTISLHSLGIFVIQFALLPLAIAGTAAVSAPRLIGFAAIASGLAIAYDRLFVQPPYVSWPGLARGGEFAPQDLPPVLPTVASMPIVAALAAVALAFAGYLFLRAQRDEEPPEVPFALCAAIGAAVAGILLGQLAAAGAMILVALLLDRPGLLRLAAQKRRWVYGLMAVGAVWAVAMVATRGTVAGLRATLYFPYPYAVSLLQQQPIVVGLAAGTTIWAILTRSPATPTRAIALSVILPILAIGAVQRWGAFRYFIHFYPFILLLAASGLTGSVSWVLSQLNQNGARLRHATMGVTLLLVVSGALGQHGLPQTIRVVTLEHGVPVNPRLHGRSFRSDHARPGRYVRDHLEDDDIVIAVDALEQAWYVGRVDYWLRGESDARTYLYTEPDEPDVFREIYVSAALLWTEEQFTRIVDENPDRTIWLTTSGEIAENDELALPSELRAVIDRVAREGEEVLVGRDGVTRVYCLNCPSDRQES